MHIKNVIKTKEVNPNKRIKLTKKQKVHYNYKFCVEVVISVSLTIFSR